MGCSQQASVRKLHFWIVFITSSRPRSLLIIFVISPFLYTFRYISIIIGILVGSALKSVHIARLYICTGGSSQDSSGWICNPGYAGIAQALPPRSRHGFHGFHPAQLIKRCALVRFTWVFPMQQREMANRSGKDHFFMLLASWAAGKPRTSRLILVHTYWSIIHQACNASVISHEFGPFGFGPHAVTPTSQ